MRVCELAVVAGLALAGCAGPGSGQGETVAVRSAPSGAACDVARGRTVLGTVDATPGSVQVDHSDKDLTVTCRKPGWRPGTATVKAVYQGIGLGQLLTGGAAAVVEDAARSNDFRYDPAGAAVSLVPE